MKAGKSTGKSADNDEKGKSTGKSADNDEKGKPASGPGNESHIESSDTYGEIPDIDKDEMIAIVHAEIKRKGIAGHHIQSMNTFYREGIVEIIEKVFSIEGVVKNKRTEDKDPIDRDITETEYKVTFANTRLKKPTTTRYASGTVELQTPNMARLKSSTYSFSVTADMYITLTAKYADGTTRVREDVIRDNRIASMPALVGSEMCNTHMQSRETKKLWEEDPNDPGGYFIVRGGEWTIDMLENLTHNIFHVYRQNYKNELARGTFISKPGDSFENSFQTIIRLLSTGALTVDVTITKAIGLKIPFYLVFRALGVTTDREICEYIAYGTEPTDPVRESVLEVLKRGFEYQDPSFLPIADSTIPSEIMTFLGEKLLENAKNVRRDDNITKYQTQRATSIFDKNFLPHLGQTHRERNKKLKFLGHLLNKLILVHLGIVQQTDRDSYRNKRVHAAGTSMAKTLKTNFNIILVQAIRKRFLQDIQSTPFSQLQPAVSIKQVTKGEALEKPMVQSIISGDKTIKHRTLTIKNRVASQTVYHKNDMNVKSILGTINTPDSNVGSKNTERADLMRRVHATYPGYIDISQSADTGEKVGMTKQISCTASVCEASSSYILKKTILDDPDVTSIDNLHICDVADQKLTKVFVAGDWIGCCPLAHEIVHRYRQARRFGRIHHLTTIVWEPLVREVYFWTDVGRLVRPLVIVYNNLPAYNEACRSGKKIEFKQWVRLRREHMTGLCNGTLTMDDLRKERVIEYIAPEEQESAYLCPNINILRERQSDIQYQYTHCDIEQAIFGIVTLAAPMASHSNSVRNTMYTNHRKQSAGWFALNYPYRMLKNTTLQHYAERPLVSAFSDSLTYPNGTNTIVALILHGGLNQEDSVVANQSSIDCGLFNASHYNYERTELEKGETLANPDRARTMDIKKDAQYVNVDNGLARPGTLATKGTVLVSKYAQVSNPVDNRIYTDRSVIYKHEEPVRVERSFVTRSDNDIQIAKVKWRADRPMTIGDKVSSRTGNKGICSSKCSRMDMPYALDGTTPDLLVNAHSIPTRMALNQIIECVLAQLACRRGARYDATCFRKIDIDQAIEDLREEGVEFEGYKRLYNGRTGCWIDSLIFVGPTVYQRLEKFVIDEHYAVRQGPTSIMTHQPLDGKINDGGLRLGEMEAWVLCGHGAMRFLHSKFYKDSDGIRLPICRTCGERAIVNETARIYRCRKCGDAADIVSVESSWVANLLANQTAMMNARMKFNMAPDNYPKYL